MSETAVREIITFWFEELTPRHWFINDATLDSTITRLFSTTLEAGRLGELWHWRTSAEGRLAEILVLDQFSRNIHRNSAAAFAQDPQALILAQEAVAQGIDSQLDASRKVFLYMPFMHSESLLIHDEAMRLFDQPGLEENFTYERKHREILVRFGRYPHRNALLGRESTPEEAAFLQEPGSSF